MRTIIDVYSSFWARWDNYAGIFQLNPKQGWFCITGKHLGQEPRSRLSKDSGIVVPSCIILIDVNHLYLPPQLAGKL